MQITLATLAKVTIILAVIGLGHTLFRKKLGKGAMFTGALFIVWFCVFASYIATETMPTYEQVSVTALDAHNEVASGNFFIIGGYTVNDKKYEISSPIQGSWAWYDISGKGNFVAGWIPGTELQPKNATNTIVLEIPTGKERKLEFYTYPWGGLAKIETSAGTVTLDAYSKVENVTTSVSIPDSSGEMIEHSQWIRLPCFAAVFFFCCLGLFGLAWFATRKGRLYKLEKYKFLFTQLVHRDFTLKYKRTVLGMFWSILSPLFNLLIMWIVFNKLLGSNVDHFIIYLFAGQLVFSYFSDASNQGMTSLIENAGIFTKINVPKYMFLLSKNVSSLINFGLTLIIFFVFVAFEKLPFTWEYLMLIYPIGCLIIFNIGLGLILSASFVFFRDMQYLWAIFTQVIMWLSAIFYSIDSYPKFGQNLFLLNPIYLFIRYFRKIVIEGQVPTIWFHLMMAGYTIVVLFIGCRIYKKNNHEFLYYI